MNYNSVSDLLRNTVQIKTMINNVGLLIEISLYVFASELIFKVSAV